MTAEDRAPTVLEVGRTAGGQHRTETLRPGTFLTPRPLHDGSGLARFALVGNRAGLLAGDELRLRVRAEAGVCLELVEPAGLLAYDHRGGRSGWQASVDIGDDGLLVWAGAPFVAATGADTLRRLDVRLGRGARMLWRESLVLGRSGERGGSLRSVTRVRCQGQDVLVEDLDLRDADERELPGVLGDARVVSTVTALGWVPRDLGHSYATELARPGAVVRLIGGEAHVLERELDAVWETWLPDARQRTN